MTYADLLARLSAVLGDDHSTDADWTNYLPAIIQQAELRCYRDLDLLALRAIATGSIQAGMSVVSTPSDWILGESVRLSDIGVDLDQRNYSFLQEYGGQGVPKYWAEFPAGTIRVAPVPTTMFNLEFSYHSRPAPLSATNTMTWLSTYCPDLLFYACMVEASGYERNYGAQADDPKMALSWAQRYGETLDTVRLEEARRKGDNAFDSSRAPPPVSNTAQG